MCVWALVCLKKCQGWLSNDSPSDPGLLTWAPRVSSPYIDTLLITYSWSAFTVWMCVWLFTVCNVVSWYDCFHIHRVHSLYAIHKSYNGANTDVSKANTVIWFQLHQSNHWSMSSIRIVSQFVYFWSFIFSYILLYCIQFIQNGINYVSFLSHKIRNMRQW